MKALMMTVQILATEPHVEVHRPMAVPLDKCEEMSRIAAEDQSVRFTGAGQKIVRQEIVCVPVERADVTFLLEEFDRTDDQ